jgi:hypothetical protein
MNRPTLRVRLLLAAVAAVVLLIGSGFIAFRMTTGSGQAVRLAPSPSPSTAPSSAPSASAPRWLAYPGQPYPGVRPLCSQVDQARLAPAVYSAPTSDVAGGTDFHEDGTEMTCVLIFLAAPATGRFDLHVWAYADPARAVTDYGKLRQQLTTAPDRGNKATTRGAITGVGQQAYEVYIPVSVSDRPNIRIQPGRHLELVLLDANLIIRASVSTLRPMGSTFPDGDQQHRDLVHQSIMDVVAKMRAGRAGAPCCG